MPGDQAGFFKKLFGFDLKGFEPVPPQTCHAPDAVRRVLQDNEPSISPQPFSIAPPVRFGQLRAANAIHVPHRVSVEGKPRSNSAVPNLGIRLQKSAAIRAARQPGEEIIQQRQIASDLGEREFAFPAQRVQVDQMQLPRAVLFPDQHVTGVQIPMQQTAPVKFRRHFSQQPGNLSAGGLPLTCSQRGKRIKHEIIQLFDICNFAADEKIVRHHAQPRSSAHCNRLKCFQAEFRNFLGGSPFQIRLAGTDHILQHRLPIGSSVMFQIENP